jgi:hypothetical protein
MLASPAAMVERSHQAAAQQNARPRMGLDLDALQRFQ